jgi:hypothetical protein
VLYDDFLGIDYRCEIDFFIPLNQLNEIADKLFGMAFFYGQSKFPYGTYREFA